MQNHLFSPFLVFINIEVNDMIAHGLCSVEVRDHQICQNKHSSTSRFMMKLLIAPGILELF